MGSTEVYPEVIRAEVAELLGFGVDAVDSNNKLVRRGRDSIRMARAGRFDGVDNCPDRVTGESWVGGRGKARGYRGSPNPTAEPDARCTGRRVAGQRSGLPGC